MSKETKTQDENAVEDTKIVGITPVIKAKIDDILILEKKLQDAMDALKIQKEQLKDAYKAVAESLSIKPAVLKERLTLIVKTDEEPEVLTGKKNSITFVQSYMENGGLPEEAKRSGNVDNEQA